MYATAPITSDKARARAEQTFKKEKIIFYDEDEIDRFLPPALKGRLEEEMETKLEE